MTRLAQRLGLEGYGPVRKAYAETVRNGSLDFSEKAETQIATQKLKGDQALAAGIVSSTIDQISKLMDPSILDSLSAAASSLALARRVYCLGLRSSHPVTWYFHYILSLLGDRAVLLDALGAVGADPFRAATESDVLLVASVHPYTRATVEIARYAASRGVPIIAITDSEVAPLAQVAKHAILVATESPSFFHTMAPAFVVAEVLSALVTGHGGEKALEAIRHTEEQLAAFKIHFRPRGTRR